MSNTPERLSAQTDDCDKSFAITANIVIRHLVPKDVSVVNEFSDLGTANDLDVFQDPNSIADVTPEPQPDTLFNCNASNHISTKSSTITQTTTTSIASVCTIVQDSCENTN